MQLAQSILQIELEFFSPCQIIIFFSADNVQYYWSQSNSVIWPKLLLLLLFHRQEFQTEEMQLLFNNFSWRKSREEKNLLL